MPGTQSDPSGEPARFRGLALVGGHPAVDFLNTVKYRGAPEPGERLVTFGDIIDWSLVAGLISAAEAASLHRTDAAGLRDAICGFREDLRSLFGPAPALPATRQRVEAAISALRPVARIDPASRGLYRDIPLDAPDALYARIVNAAAGLLAQAPDLRFGTCRACDCDWLFIDRTRVGRRVWCDTRTCGNAARVRRYRDARRRTGPLA